MLVDAVDVVPSDLAAQWAGTDKKSACASAAWADRDPGGVLAFGASHDAGPARWGDGVGHSRGLALSRSSPSSTGGVSSCLSLGDPAGGLVEHFALAAGMGLRRRLDDGPCGVRSGCARLHLGLPDYLGM